MSAGGCLRELDAIVARRNDLVGRLRALPEAELAVRPGPDVWSALEVVEHMVVAERAVLRGLFEPRLLEQPRQTLRHRIMNRLIIAILRGPISVKVPTRSMVPSGERGLEEMVADWEETHRRLRDFIEGADPARLAAPAFRHPVSGPLTAAQATRMLGVHLERHTKQILERLPGR